MLSTLKYSVDCCDIIHYWYVSMMWVKRTYILKSVFHICPGFPMTPYHQSRVDEGRGIDGW